MGLIQTLQQRGIYRAYLNHVVRLEPILRRCGERGVPVDAERFAAVEAQLQADMARHSATMQSLVPPEVKAFKAYKKVPKAALGVNPNEGPLPPGYGYVNGTWLRYLPWSPSNAGLLRYIRHRGHPVPKDLKGQKDTTSALEIRRLYRSTKDPLYQAVIEYRKAQTMLTNHIENWRPGVGGRVHPTFYFDPATGQLSSRRPNVQNAPKHDDAEFGSTYATAFRAMVKANPGFTIMEFDYSGFHVATLAFEAQDLDLLRIGRIDLHSFVTAHFLHLPDAGKLFTMPDDQLRVRLAEIKRLYKHDRNAKVKHAILGYNNGLGYRKLYRQYAEYFRDEREAKSVVSLMDGLFPKSKQYREDICHKAHDQGYLVSRHGYIRYFWEIFRYQGGRWSSGDDHEAALCYFTQNDAHGELKDRLLAMDALGYLERYGFINTIHDSIMLECPNNLVDECARNVKIEMERPSTVLIDPIVAPHGLSVAVDVQGGPDWANMKGIDAQS